MMGSRVLLLLCLLPLAVGATKRPPLRDGEYAFRHRSAEHPNFPVQPLVARITGTRIVLINRTPSSVLPLGLVAEGELIQGRRDVDIRTEKRPQITGRERRGISLITKCDG